MEKLNTIEAPAAVPASGRYIFRDNFDSLEQWNVIAGSPSILGSVLSLSGANGGSQLLQRKIALVGREVRI
jgi:hypothetical protein